MFGRDYDTSDVGNLYMISGFVAVGVKERKKERKMFVSTK